jgi:2-oxoglutarate/2-oxoacid ferredoxin oxidoreductase subunit alpha
LPELPKNQYYKRYQVTPDGISPRVIPGTKNGMHHSTGLEHDETGRPFEGTANRIAQTDKRQRKMPMVIERFFQPVKIDAPYDEADLLVVGVGASFGPIMEAVARLRQEGIRVNQAGIRLLQPFPVQVMEAETKKAKRLIVVEHNATAQLASLLRMRMKVDMPIHSVLKYDGNPFRPTEIVDGCREVL